ncbi:hypothetical protein ACHAWF_009879 [Thalassiosira exigua]
MRQFCGYGDIGGCQKGDGDIKVASEAFLTIENVPVYFSEDWNTGIGGGLWSTGLAMAKYFERHAGDVVENLKCLVRARERSSCREWDFQRKNNDASKTGGLSALELGSGNGFLSVCLLALAAHEHIPLHELVVTDMADHLALMTTTLRNNPHVWEQLTEIQPRSGNIAENENENENKTLNGSLSQVHPGGEDKQPSLTRVTIAEHLWGQHPSNNHPGENDFHSKKYDFIFGSDLAYRNSLHKPLIKSLLQFSHQHTLCLIGVTMSDTQPSFFDLLTEAGFRYERLADHLLEKEFRGINFGIIAIQRR